MGNQGWTYTPDGLPDVVTTYNSTGGSTVTNAYSYNKRRMLVGEAMTRGTGTPWSIGYGYDGNGSASTLVYPSGLTISFAPNALGQPTQAGSYATGVQYYPNGAIKQFSYGNGIVHTMTQNARQLPSRSTDCTLSGTCATANRRLDLAYGYDEHGNVGQITDHVNGRQTRGMAYDDLDRLTQTTSAMFGTASYTYDVLDNLLTTNVTAGSNSRNHTYVYEASSNRLTQIKQTVGGAVVANLGYDVRGNLASKGTQTYQFDYGNRLRSVPGKEAGYQYDAQGRRVYGSTTGSSYIVSQYSQAGVLLYQQDYKQAKRLEYVYLGGSLVAFRETPHGTSTSVVKYQHTDALGTPIAVTDAAKAIIETSEYEPYGQLVNSTLKDGPGFTGHVQDAATGLTYMQQRYYDPQVGLFLSVDPVTAYSNPVGMFNRYKYAANNPYRFVDPDGRQEKTKPEREERVTGSNFPGNSVAKAMIATTAGEGAIGRGAKEIGGALGRGLGAAGVASSTGVALLTYSAPLADGTIAANEKQDPTVQIYRVMGAAEYLSTMAKNSYIPWAPSGWLQKQFWLSPSDVKWFIANDPGRLGSERFVVSSLIHANTLSLGHSLVDAGHPFVSFGPAALGKVSHDARKYGGIYTLEHIPAGGK